MPKDEFDFEDPFELNGMAFLTQEDTTNDMAECFIEEFMRLGYNHKQVLALFRNPQYVGPHLALEKRGEPFVRELITEVFARWGRPVVWGSSCSSRREEAPTENPQADQSLLPSAAPERPTDPMGAPIPDFTI